ncbi:FAD-dependent monooxygenase [Streptomyces odontomachi]|uniref:FAD-dependent monooxygenase n=1 Tax=Streptomyces odontomachi TaxID=2944940 RepID=UPI0021095472|nr:FAD-dependent monooxygenase [Streptomyces sp. ODS25]
MNHTVIVAGAGPVGLLLACELRLHGVETVVLERHEEQLGQALGNALNSATVELLDQRAVMSAIREDGFEWPLAYFAGYQLDPEALAERHNNTFIVSQSNLERRLEAHAVALGATVRRGHEIIGVEQDAEQVTVTVRSASGTSRLTGGYLVGCDGTGSTVRTLSQIEFPGEDLPFHGIAGDLEVEPDDELFQRVGAHQQDRGPFMLAQVGERAIRIAMGEFGTAPAHPEQDPDEAEMRALAERLTGRPLTTGRPLWLSRWHNVTRQADRYRKDRVFLAGDAAHTHFPLSGLALNTGLEDALNLGWKLAAALAGHAPDGLLDSYHDERHPVGTRACMATRAQVALTHPVDSIRSLRELFGEMVKLPEVNEYLINLSCGLAVRYPAADEGQHPLVGRRLVNTELVTPGGTTTVARLLHPGLGVYLDLSDGAVPVPDLSELKDRVTEARAEPAAEIPAAAVLLRPDGRVAWATGTGTERGAGDATDAGPEAALARWFGAVPAAPELA